MAAIGYIITDESKRWFSQVEANGKTLGSKRPRSDDNMNHPKGQNSISLSGVSTDELVVTDAQFDTHGISNALVKYATFYQPSYQEFLKVLGVDAADLVSFKKVASPSANMSLETYHLNESHSPSCLMYRFSFLPKKYTDRFQNKEGLPSDSESDLNHLKTLALQISQIPLPKYIHVVSSYSHQILSKHFVYSLQDPALFGAKSALDGCETIPTLVPCESELMSSNPRVPDLDSIKNLPLLLVGAGGIGCEILKVLVLEGFKRIDVIDLDTIDATNLNRQFLFQKKDVGSSKSEIAKQSVLGFFKNKTCANLSTCTLSHWSTLPMITAYHDNIKSEAYGEAFYRSFAVVLNALDNVSARKHVNHICMQANIPLIESGSMGYNGQVQPIVKGYSACYDCFPKSPEQQSFAVCTIHARPTNMVHCVHYAKELYETLFGVSNIDEEKVRGEQEDSIEASAPSKAGQNDLRSEEGELSYLKAIVENYRTDDADGDSVCRSVGVNLINCIYRDKIIDLLAMKSTWPTQPPVPLGEETIRAAERTLAKEQKIKELGLNFDLVLPLDQLLHVFILSAFDCAKRKRVSFQKDDDTGVLFVAAAANLRAHVFHIEEKSVEDIRGIAGSIVPAVATTNAMVAASVVHHLYLILQQFYDSRMPNKNITPSNSSFLRERDSDFAKQLANALQIVYVRKVPQVRRRRVLLHDTPLKSDFYVQDRYLIHSAPPNMPNPQCMQCQEIIPTVKLSLEMDLWKLSDLVHTILENTLQMEEPSISLGNNIIYDEDYTSLLDQKLSGFFETAIEKTHPNDRTLDMMVDALNRSTAWRLIITDTLSNGTSATNEEKNYSIEGLTTAFEVEARVEKMKETEDEQILEQPDTKAETLSENTIVSILSEEDLEEDVINID